MENRYSKSFLLTAFLLVSFAIFSHVNWHLPSKGEDCDAGLTSNAKANTSQTATLLSAMPALVDCGEDFFDQGGATGNYQNNQNITTTICPDNPGEFVKVRFNVFDIAQYDALTVFDGNNTGGYIFGSYTGTKEPFSVYANNGTGCLTFQFYSDGTEVGAGWEAAVECQACPGVNNLGINASTPNSVYFNWYNDWQNAYEYEYEVGLPGFAPGTGAAVSAGSVLFATNAQATNLENETEYELYVRSKCSADTWGEFSGPVRFTTAPTCGDTFYDSAGPNGNIVFGEISTTIICPETPGQFVALDFSLFDIGNNYITIYDGNYEGNNYINTYNIYTVPNIISSTSNSGCLTIAAYMNSDPNPVAPGWEAAINCVSCPMPPNSWVDYVGTNRVTLHWNLYSFAPFNQWEIGLEGFAPGTGAAEFSGTSDNEYAEVIGLESATRYDFYVRAACQNGQFSEWRKGKFTTLPTCGDTFTDSGGATGDYAPFENTVTTICPETNGEFVSVTFSSFELDSCCTTLYAYDGDSQWSGYSLGAFKYGDQPGTITATNPTGCISFTLYNSGQLTAPGWVSQVNCITCPPPSGLTVYDPTATGVSVQWNQLYTAEYYYYEVVPEGQMPGTGAAVASGNVNTNSLFVTGLESGTAYQFYIKANCGPGEESQFGNPAGFRTLPSCGDHFYDPGGPNENHPIYSYANTTICPDVPGTFVQVVFNEFDLNPCCSSLSIWDGQISQSFTGSVLPTPLTSVDQSGCLTFTFNTNDPTPRSGWDATINCVTCPNPTGLRYEDLTASTAKIIWNATPASTGYAWEVGPMGFQPGTGNATSTGSTADVFTILLGLESGTYYDFYVKNRCSATDESIFAGPFRFYTSPTCGDSYTDPGGPNADFPLGAGTVSIICPDVPGHFIQLQFEQFDLGDCCSWMDIYDGNYYFGGQHIGLYSGHQSPGTISSTDNSGCITIHTNLYGDQAPGWLADVTCVTCPKPYGLNITENAGESARISWNYMAFVNDFEWEVGYPGFLPGNNESEQSGSVATSQVILSGLNSLTEYEFFVRSKCAGSDRSSFSGPIKFKTPPSCGDKFVDSGGTTADYGPNEYVETKICPNSSSSFVALDFTDFDVDQCCAYMTITDGNYFWETFSNNNKPDVIYSNASNGCLNVQFYNNGTTTAKGWEADIICTDCPPPNKVDILQPLTFDGAMFQWNPVSSSISSFQWEVVLPGALPGTGQSVANGTSTETLATVTGLQSQTDYEFYVRSNCGNSNLSPFGRPIKFRTSLTCGDTFYDPAGPDSSYVSGGLYSVTTICPDEPGTVVEVTFESLNIQPWKDYIYVYDGATTNSNQIGSFNGMVMPLPGPFTASNASGCLTFVLSANASGAWEGWEASINCVTCPKVNNLTATVTNTVQLNWSELGTATKYHWEVGLPGFEPGTGNAVATGTSTTNSATVTGLDSGTAYEAYVRAECSGGELGTFSNMAALTTPASCGDKFYDQGGPDGNYTPYQNYVVTICPQGNGQHVTARFNMFQTESCCDYLTIHNGENTNFPTLAQISGSPSVPFEYTSTAQTGCLTFNFYGYYSGAGWEADILCDGCIAPLDFQVEDITSNGVDLSWQSVGDANTYNYEVGPKGFTPGIGLATLVGNIATNHINLTGLQAGKGYDAYVRSICAGAQVGDFAGPLRFVTPISCGSISYDSGGPNDDYGPNEDTYTLICSEVANSSVWLEFQAFETQQCCDILEILDGNTESAPSLGTFSGNSSPGIVTANNDSGCLMLHFTSDATVHRSGWKALVQCTTPSTEVSQQGKLLEISPNPAKDWLYVKLPDEKAGTLQVVDVAGRVKWKGAVDNGSARTTVPLSGLPAGIYFLRWQSQVARFVVEP